MTDENVLELLAGVPLFTGVGSQTLAFLATRLRPRRFRRGEVIVRQGEPSRAFFLITAGRTKVSLITEDGQEGVLGLIGEGGCIGEVTVLDGGPRSATVTAVEPTEALTMASEELLAAIREDPDLALALIGTLAARLRAADSRLEDAYFSDLETRLARRLLQIAEQHGHATEAGIEASLPLTQSELASMLGAGRPRVNGALGSLQDADLIRLGKGTFTVLDPAGLRRRAGR